MINRAGDGHGRVPAEYPKSGAAGGKCPAGPALLTRGYSKIADAARAFNFDFRGKTVLDIGSSTGGFTKYALDHGAKKVIAIEKGTHQMASLLRNDPHIDLHEKTDIFDIRVLPKSSAKNDGQEDGAGDGHERVPAEYPKSGAAGGKCPAGPSPDIIMADVSFISLTKVLMHAKQFLSDIHTDFLVMLKPQFEATPSQLNKGVIKNERIRRDIIKEFETWLKQHNFIIINKRDNVLKGKTGNQERFYHLKLAK